MGMLGYLLEGVILCSPCSASEKLGDRGLGLEYRILRNASGNVSKNIKSNEVTCKMHDITIN